MLNSLRFRLLAAFALIVAITLISAGVAFWARLGSYRDELTRSSLQQSAAPIYYNLTLFIPQRGQGVLLREELQQYLALQGKDSDLVILLIDGRGAVIPETTADPELLDETFIVPAAPERGRPNFEALPQKKFTSSEGDDFLYVIVPMPKAFRTNADAIHGILVGLPEASARDVFGDLMPRLLFAGGVGLLAAALVGLLMWASVYGPLARARRAIGSIAAGDYRQRVPEKGPEEVRGLARSVNTMADSVQSSQRTLRDFLANVSHELKTPLTSIRGFAGAMTDGTLNTDEERARALRVIDAESRRVLHLVEELLDLSRIESGQHQMEISDVSVGELLAHVADVFSMRAAETGVALHVGPAGRAIIRADFDRMEQVLGNLIDNAFRHTPAGGRIEIGVTGVKDGAVELYVADNGEGIASEDLPHVFDRFYRSEGPERPGSGLGLTIAREIVRAHGGEIRAESPPAGGTRFTITLPGKRTALRQPRPDTETPASGELTPDLRAPASDA